MRRRCRLVLSDGSHLTGHSVGAPVSASGELVFSTGMVGYSEAVTDPSYFGQILCFSYPLIGNYGIPSFSLAHDDIIPEGFESGRPQTAGVIVTLDSSEAFHWNSFQTFDAWLKAAGVPGIAGIDTRHLIQRIRSTPRLLGRIESDDCEATDVGGFFDPGALNILPQVSTAERRRLGGGSRRLAVIDCGIKWNIVRQLLNHSCEIELVPWDTDPDTVDCDGWLVSNGPGNPAETGVLPGHVAKLLNGNRPVLGICLGHQVIALAAGATTSRMPYGHRSHNQPVYLAGTRRGFMTTQNHGYVVDASSLPDEWEPWFYNVNDQSIEGLRHRGKPFASVQFHPEAAGGPRDTAWIITEFMESIKEKHAR